MALKDANELLKEEISESGLRLKQAKYGHRIDEIAPAYENTFYLPNKARFISPPKTNASTTRHQQSVFERSHLAPLQSSVMKSQNHPMTSLSASRNHLAKRDPLLENQDSIFLTQKDQQLPPQTQHSKKFDPVHSAGLSSRQTTAPTQTSVYHHQGFVFTPEAINPYCQPPLTPREREQLRFPRV